VGNDLLRGCGDAPPRTQARRGGSGVGRQKRKAEIIGKANCDVHRAACIILRYRNDSSVGQSLSMKADIGAARLNTERGIDICLRSGNAGWQISLRMGNDIRLEGRAIIHSVGTIATEVVIAG